MKRQGLSKKTAIFPVSPEGDPVAHPKDEVLRPPLTLRAGPASPERLLVYPLRDGAIVGQGMGGEDDGDLIYFFWAVRLP
jgi:hypothetical protein